MRHQRRKKTLGRLTAPRKALFVSLCVNLLLNGKITTTEAKAKALRPKVEKLITKAKKGDSLATRRLLLAHLGGNEEVVKKLLTTIGPKYKERNGGYTRITKTGTRQGDAAPMATIELI